jgi:plastocyanin
MDMKKFIALGLTAMLLGAGCAPAPTTQQTSPEPTPTPSTETVAPSATEPTPTPTPTPTAPKTVTPKPAPKPKTKTVTVEIKDNVFSPQIVAINAGDTVIWKNAGQSNHTVHNITGVLWDSGNMAPGATFQRTFPASGRYEYGCGIHTGMRGTVIVGEVQANP